MDEERGRMTQPRQRNAETHPACQPLTCECAAPEKGSVTVGEADARVSKYIVDIIESEINNGQAVQQKLPVIGACDPVSLICVR